MPQSALRRNAPALLLLAVYAAFAALVLAAWSRDLDRALAPAGKILPLIPSVLRSALGAYADPRFDPSTPAAALPQRLALLLVPEKGLHASLKRSAFAILLHLRYEPDDIARRYLSRVPLGTQTSRTVQGIPRAVHVYFNVQPDRLYLGEALLLCHMAFSPHPFDLPGNPSAALAVRRRLLTRMKAAGLLTSTAYQTEIARPLALRENHIPIW